MQEVLIIIGARGGRVAEAFDDEAMTFRTLSEFDRWRHGMRSSGVAETIEVDVMAALRELGKPRFDLSGEVRLMVELLCDSGSVPPRVEQIVPDGVEYRTLHRRWTDLMPEGLKEFLERVRLLHARRLIEQQGLSRSEAASRAGYRSSSHMGQAILRRARRNAGE